MHWDIFCRVIDNFGDAGVCWRLAADLSQRGEEVRLFIDEPAVLTQLAGTTLEQAGLEIRVWPGKEHRFDPSDVADVVIEAFACDPPTLYVDAMARRAERMTLPVWINLEYLSAEEWVGTHHRLPSPHPRYPLTKYFYFPGFTPDSGGLLREPGAVKLTEDVTPPEDNPARTLRILLFCYRQPALQYWVDALDGVTLSVTPCPASTQIMEPGFHVPERLTIQHLSFVPQSAFDGVLREHDLLFVRGEDSFVRAQWAAKPVFWQIYPQDDGVHLEKLHAFYARYLDPSLLNPQERQILMDFLLAWNRTGEPHDCRRLWPPIIQMLPALRENALRWRDKLLQQPDLVTQLRAFVANLVK